MQSTLNLEILVTNIEALCTKNNIDVKNMLIQCGNKRQDVDNMKKGSKPSIEKIMNIADFFNVSIDDLIGRSEYFNDSIGHINVSIGHINGDNSVQANDNGNIQINTAADDGMTMEFMAMFEKLSLKDRIKVMNYALELSEKK